MGKIIYESKGKASEYSKYAFSAYLGCSNLCNYCYLKKGVLSKTLGGNIPELKKSLIDEDNAILVFENELAKNIKQLQKHGLFFSFTTDPLLKETRGLTVKAVKSCVSNGVPVKILSKTGVYEIEHFTRELGLKEHERSKIALGYTLTGHNEQEPKARKNHDRIVALHYAKEYGYRTFISIEPIIDFESSLEMIKLSSRWCSLFKIGLMAGKKYDYNEAEEFIASVIILAYKNDFKVYFKDSLLSLIGMDRSNLPSVCVKRDYNLFK